MRTFEDIRSTAIQHQGSETILDERIESGRGAALNLAKTSDDRLLSQMTKNIFQSGFVWKVIENKWPGFEAAFDNFDPPRVAFYADDDIDRLMSDKAIVRNGAKIEATIHNARFVTDIAKEHGSFRTFLAEWPIDDQIGLMDVFKKRGKRLSGMTVQYFLRFAGWDAFILSQDVTAALIREGVIAKPATSKTALKAVQTAFNEWANTSGKMRTEISRTLALSV